MSVMLFSNDACFRVVDLMSGRSRWELCRRMYLFLSQLRGVHNSIVRFSGAAGSNEVY